MARRRLLVALVPPAELLEPLRALRALLGGPERERIPPHVTLVPPFNLPDERVDEVRVRLRDAVRELEPFAVDLGPAASFAPANPTIHLVVGGDGRTIAALHELRDRLRVGPMDRPDRHEFVPHLTLRRNAPDPVTDAAPAVLCGQLPRWEVDRLHLLEQVHHDSGTIWSPIAEEPFGGPVVVGRGGVELHLRTVGTDEPERVMVLAELAGTPGVVIARVDGSVGASLARLRTLEVAREHRGLGIARQVLARWCTDAARRGATVALAESGPAEPASIQALVPLGFTVIGGHSVGGVAVRELQRGTDG